ncbi:DUF433 domain-containing protein [Candidatus Entotheonella palauensis]|uniref:DUF433 domain-containing protein n=1 Tax=Candidatus Entotheonella gemina TaxID=1429439 RepID=W4LVF5_9BACT|nr:DUF433 domain-containing protein [Candidatus Entotheonella palauensis]ETX01751.1 MAG: hypothetical protein ETSY2_36690 [Candidatus Entotheonella gemina]
MIWNSEPVTFTGGAIVAAKIIDRGRGPEIAGTRITVYDVVDYLTEDWRAEHIAAMFRLPIEDIEAAIDYIESHREEVIADYQQILARHQRARESPEMQAMLAPHLEAFRAKVEARRKQQDEVKHAERDGGS